MKTIKVVKKIVAATAKKMIVPGEVKRSMTISAVNVCYSTLAKLTVKIQPDKMRIVVEKSYRGLGFSPSRKMPKMTPYTIAMEEVPVNRISSAKGNMTIITC